MKDKHIDIMLVAAVFLSMLFCYLMIMESSARYELQKEAVRRGYGSIVVDQNGDPRFQWLGEGERESTSE